MLKPCLILVTYILLTVPIHARVHFIQKEAGYDAQSTQNKDILDTDSRRPIISAGKYLRKIGQIETNSGRCTGTLVGPRHVLTAGHCLYSPKTGWKQKNTTYFYAGRVSENQYLRKAKAVEFLVAENWNKKGDRRHDYGMIILNKPIGKSLGWFSFGHSSKITNMKFNLIGYPSDKPNSSLWKAFCSLHSVSKDFLFHYCDTYDGMSGAGLYYLHENERTIYAVHTFGNNLYNEAVRINKQKFDQIKDWKKKFP